MAENGFHSDFGIIDESFEVFITENPDELYVTFQLIYDCESTEDISLTEAQLTIRGECKYSPSQEKFSEMRRRESKLSYKLPDGEEKIMKNIVVIVGGLTIGHETIHHNIRKKLEY